MANPTTGTPEVDVLGKIWLVTTLPFNATTALCLEYTGDGLQDRGANFYNDGTRGTRSRARERLRRASVFPGGSITLTPTKTELRTLLPLILGTAESGAGSSGSPYAYTLAEALPTFYVLQQSAITAGHTGAVALYEGCVISRASFSASQSGPLTLTLEIEASTCKHYVQGTVNTAFDGSTAVISSGTAVPSSVPNTEGIWMFYDTQQSGNMELAGVHREAFDWTLSIDNALDTGRFMNSLYRRAFPSGDRIVSMAATVPYTTAEDDLAVNASGLLGPDINASSPDLLDNIITFYAERGTNDDVLQFDVGCWEIEPAFPQKNGKGETVLPLAGTCYKKNTSTVKNELSASIWTT